MSQPDVLLRRVFGGQNYSNIYVEVRTGHWYLEEDIWDLHPASQRMHFWGFMYQPGEPDQRLFVKIGYEHAKSLEEFIRKHPQEIERQRMVIIETSESMSYEGNLSTLGTECRVEWEPGQDVQPDAYECKILYYGDLQDSKKFEAPPEVKQLKLDPERIEWSYKDYEPYFERPKDPNLPGRKNRRDQPKFLRTKRA